MKNTNTFITQASQGDNQWWKYLLSLLCIVLAFIIGQIPITAFNYFKKSSLKISDTDFNRFLADMDLSKLGITENTFFFLLLLMFVFVFIVFIGILPIIHKRNTKSFITSRKRFDFNRFFIGLSIWLILAIIIIFVLLEPNQYEFNFKIEQFIPLLLISICLIPIQAGVEEMFYRGYLLQGIFKLTKNRWITLILVTILFALSHAFNPEFKNGFLTMIPAYLIFSFTMSYITLLDNGLEIPIGIHTGNNLFVAVILSANGASVTTPSIFKTNLNNLVDLLPLLFVLLSLSSFMILKTLYKWKYKI